MATAPKTAESPDAAARREVSRMLKGPVAQTFKTLIPPLAGQADPYKAIMESPELLDGCFKLFRLKRDSFAAYLIDAEGKPVSDDKQRLKCGRSVDEVIGMAVRTGMRAYAEQFFGDPIDPSKVKQPKPSGVIKPPPKKLFKLINIGKLADLFRRNHGIDKPLPVGQSKSGRFYAAIKDSLDFEWQVPFFPVYVEIPAHVFDKLGIGITRMDSEEKLQRLAQLALTDINKAEAIIRNPELAREMMANNVLASAAVSEMGQSGFDAVHGALDHLDAKKKWDVFANKDTARKLHEDKRITKSDIEALADYLDMLNEFALDAMLDLNLNRDQMKMFLKTAKESLGEALFMALFGPIQMIVPDDHDEQTKLRKYQAFTQTALRNLVTAVKQLEEQARKTRASGGGADDGSGIAECLATVCRTRRIDLEKEIKKLAPASVGA